MKVCTIGYSCNLVNCSSLPTVRRFLLTKCYESSYLTLVFNNTAEKRLVNDRDWNQQSCFAMWKLTPISCPVEAVRCSNSIKATWRVHLRCHALFTTSSPSSSPRFSLLAVIFRTTPKKITPRRFQQHLQKNLCVVESCFTFSFSPIPQLSQYHRPNPRSKSLSPCSIKMPQFRVC